MTCGVRDKQKWPELDYDSFVISASSSYNLHQVSFAGASDEYGAFTNKR